MTGLLAAWFLLATQTFAQSDPNAKKILDAVESKLKTMSSLQANYSLTSTTKTGKNAGSKTGTLLLKNGKYMISDKSLQIYCDGVTLWRYDPEANEVAVGTAPAHDNAFTPLNFFTTFWNKEFIFKLNGIKPVGGKSLAQIELTPTAKNTNYLKVYLTVDQTQNVITGMKIVENSGNSDDYSVSSLKTNVPLADNTFVFDKSKHPGVKVVTLSN